MKIILYYPNFCKALLAAGFKLNPYDTCVASQVVNGKQQTIFWNVDNCKLINVDTKVNGKFLEVPKQEYDSIFKDGYGKMTANNGNIYKYIGMTIDYTTKSLCKTTMFD